MKKRTCALALVLCLCLGLLSAAIPSVHAAEYPEVSYETARESYGFTVDLGDIDLGEVTRATEVDDQLLTVTNTGSRLLEVDMIRMGGYGIWGSSVHRLNPGDSFTYRLDSLGFFSDLSAGVHSLPVRFRCCYDLQTRWDYIGSAAFESKVGGFDFEVDALTVTCNIISDEEFQNRDWVAFSGFTDGLLPLGQVHQTAIKAETFSGETSFTVTNLLPEEQSLRVDAQISDADDGLDIEPRLDRSTLAPGDSAVCTVRWTFRASERPLPDSLSGSSLCLFYGPRSSKGKTEDIPLSLDFSSTGGWPLQIKPSPGGRIVDSQGNTLTGEQAILPSGLELRFTPDPGYYVSNVVVNGSSVGTPMKYHFDSVGKAQSLAVTFDPVSTKQLHTFPMDGFHVSTNPSYGSTTFWDQNNIPITVTLFPAGTLFRNTAYDGLPGNIDGWSRVTDLQKYWKYHSLPYNERPAEPDFYISDSGGLNKNIPVQIMGGHVYAEFPSDRPISIGSWNVMVVSSHPGPRNLPSPWAEPEVEGAISAGILPNMFRRAYDKTTTRAEFCALAAEAYEVEFGPVTDTQDVSFTDTTDPDVLKMAHLGVVNGVGNGLFAPDQPLTREQAATMLSRLAIAMGKPLTETGAAFADQDQISPWAAEAVSQMRAAGVMGGVGEDRFDPSGSYTREQSIATVLRLYRQMI